MLSLGLSLTGLGTQGGGSYIITVAGGGIEPVAEDLTAGDQISDIANFATIDSTANFQSSAGTISTVEWLVDGTDQAGTFTLSAGESVVVRVTDSVGNPRDWTIDASVAATGSALLLETGDTLLLETGDRLLLEA